MTKTRIFYNQLVNNVRLYLIEKLIGKKFKIISNIKITNDILKYNNGVDALYNVRVKKVSDRQSFIFSSSVYECRTDNTNNIRCQ